MVNSDFEDLPPQRPKMKIWYNIAPLASAALAWFLFSIELDVHNGISANEIIIEYLPKFTAASTFILSVSLLLIVAYWSLIFRRANPYQPGNWFWIGLVVLPILAGLGEYAAVQYRLNANNYERCYAYISEGERHYKPFFEEIVRKQIWAYKGDC